MLPHLHILSCLLAVLCSIVIYFAASVLYNIFLHPLRSYPGPVLLRATRLGFCYRLIRGTLPYDILALHKTYGDVVRVAPNELSYSNAAAWKDIMGHRTQGAQEFIKDPKFYSLSKAIPSTIISSNGKEHAALRRSVAHGFSERNLREQQPLIMQYVDLFIQRLHEHSKDDQPVDLNAWYNFTTFDIIGDLAFGEPFGCLDKSEYHPWIRGIFVSVRTGTIVQTANHYPFFKNLLFKLLATKSAQEQRLQNFNRAKDKLERRMAAGGKEGRPDLIQGLLRRKDELGLSMDQLVANGNTLIIAGSETTATLLCGVTYYLLKHGDALKRLTEEIRSTFKYEDEMDVVSVNQLTYMLACLSEALRVYPSVATALPRVAPEEGATICGRFVPGGTTVTIHQYAIHRDEKYFRKPSEFHPERFLDDPEFASDNREAFQPFHVGPRNCVGRNLAFVEMRLILARLIWNFDLSLADESGGWAEKQKIYILWDKAPLMVHLNPVSRT
ncbi:Cytochrome P450 monooxygenase aclL [Colletotrichum trifolii]|uniref:Cytochrome P450 monooxygenase aclL n=1 Tax=Colletotrichum trifolii TaxID=5466 RepID=A0A4R8QD85_COLTR|nr:Cytochrome P450 monooxygenase aclL [Colletotrichum trifolii]